MPQVKTRFKHFYNISP